MTPLIIEILLHYFYSPTEYRNGDLSAPAVRDGIVWLRDEAMLIRTRAERNEYGSTYEVTDRGRAHIENLKALPLPISKWVMPPFAGANEP